MPDTELLAIYTEGDIPTEWNELIVAHQLESLEGSWEILPERSDPCDEIMAALGIGAIKRSIMRNYKTHVDICIIQEAETRPKVNIVTSLPMGVKKQGTVFTDGAAFKQSVLQN